MRRARIVVASFLGLLAASLGLLAGDYGPAPERPVVLLTGFAPFGGRPRNASWDAIKPLNERKIDGAEIRCIELPVEWGRVRAPLADAIDALKPKAVICLGEGRLGTFSIESVARNAVAPHPDNAKKLPGRTFVIEDAPKSYISKLPIAKILDALTLKPGGFRIQKSENAGKYLCEECFFTLMHLGTERLKESEPHGFVHVPPHPAPEDPAASDAHAAKIRETVLSIVNLVVRENPALFPVGPAESAAAGTAR